jgi:hypothetical protein
MNNARRPRTPPQKPIDRSDRVRARASPGGRLSALPNARRAALELWNQIEIWVNEGGAGGEVNR